ncbi:hypothetical protein BY996DRAFT_6424639 [Phakopsora pachyrhizi]|nr:hypothetical protein BY996DRAFT_6424639 [Phakopsora pachyrhizi]
MKILTGLKGSVVVLVNPDSWSESSMKILVRNSLTRIMSSESHTSEKETRSDPDARAYHTTNGQSFTSLLFFLTRSRQTDREREVVMAQVIGCDQISVLLTFRRINESFRVWRASTFITGHLVVIQLNIP